MTQQENQEIVAKYNELIENLNNYTRQLRGRGVGVTQVFSIVVHVKDAEEPIVNLGIMDGSSIILSQVVQQFVTQLTPVLMKQALEENK